MHAKVSVVPIVTAFAAVLIQPDSTSDCPYGNPAACIEQSEVQGRSWGRLWMSMHPDLTSHSQ